MKDESRGLWLGLLGVVLFAITLPMTKLATGPAQAPLLSPVFVTFGRAAVAGLLSLVYLSLTTGARPRGRRQWGAVAFIACCVVVGFPLFLALGLRHVEAVHASVVIGILPLATAVIGSLWLRQRPSAGFWLCAIAGSVLVAVFVLLRNNAADSNAQWADLLLVLAVLSAAFGYVGGGRLTLQLGAERTICWVLVISLPITLPVMLMSWPATSMPTSAWLGFTYVAVVSMWIGFFAWYRGLALGGTVRVSQVQLVQPFLSMLFAVPLLGESLDLMTVGFALAVIATVFIGKKMPVTAATVQAPYSPAITSSKETP